MAASLSLNYSPERRERGFGETLGCPAAGPERKMFSLRDM
jgi:hypothetical protein